MSDNGHVQKDIVPPGYSVVCCGRRAVLVFGQNVADYREFKCLECGGWYTIQRLTDKTCMMVALGE